MQGTTDAAKSRIWARYCCINDSLETGSMLPYLDQAEREGYSSIILNPNMRLDSTTNVWPQLTLFG